MISFREHRDCEATCSLSLAPGYLESTKLAELQAQVEAAGGSCALRGAQVRWSGSEVT